MPERGEPSVAAPVTIAGGGTSTAPENNVSPSLAELGRAFLVVGALAFGGQGGLIALLSRDIAERRRWITDADIAESYTYVQLLPGAVVVQVVAYLGWKIRRGWGATVATVAFLVPSVVVMLLLAVLYQRLSALAGVPAALNGLTATVVGLIAVATAKQARKNVVDSLGVLLAVGALTASVVFHVNPALLVVGAGMIGIAREALSPRVTADPDIPAGPSR